MEEEVWNVSWLCRGVADKGAEIESRAKETRESTKAKHILDSDCKSHKRAWQTSGCVT